MLFPQRELQLIIHPLQNPCGEVLFLDGRFSPNDLLHHIVIGELLNVNHINEIRIVAKGYQSAYCYPLATTLVLYIYLVDL